MRVFLAIVCAFLSLHSCSQSLTERIQKAYEQFAKDPQLKYGISSLTVLNAETGEVVFSANGNVGLPPASTLKTVTSLTALNLLGKDFTWKTNLGYTGKINTDGTLDGDIILVGGGDPALGSWRYEQSKPAVLFEQWVKAIRQAGIKRINGSVIADDRLFGTHNIPLGWVWQDIGSYYGAGASSVSWGENQYGLVFKAGTKVGEATKLIRTVPEMNYIKMVNEVTTGPPGSGDNVYIYAAPYTEVMYVRGTYGIDLQKTVFAALPDPAFEASYRLQDTLKRIGITVSKTPGTYRRLALNNQSLPADPKVINTYTSPTLGQLIYWFNQKSLNLYGEHILKTLAWKQGKNVNTDGPEIVRKYWAEKLSADPNSMKIMDGSGLSPETRVTTLSLAKILQSAKKEPWFNIFLQSLPQYNNMQMKSGSIREVLAYAGYHTNRAGVPLAFSVITSNYSGSTAAVRQKLFNLLDSLK